MAPRISGTPTSHTASTKRRWKHKPERIQYADAAAWTLAETRAEEMARRAGLHIRRIYDIKAGDHTGFVAKVVRQIRSLPVRAKAALLAWLIQDQIDGMLEDPGCDPVALYHAMNRMETERQGALDQVQMLGHGRSLTAALIDDAEEGIRAHLVALHLLLAVGRAVKRGTP